MSRRSLCRYGPYGPPAPGPSSQSRPSQRSVSRAEPTYSSVTLALSVSSIRSTNVPPVRRANAQSYSAVRMLPTCRSPLGDGANLTRTPVFPGALRPASATDDHPVPQCPYALDRHGDLVTVLQRAHARRRAGQQHVPRQQRHHFAHEGDERGHVVHHLRGTGPLPDLAVHGRGDRDVGYLGRGLDPRAERAERVEALGARPLPVPRLEIPRRDVVRARVAEDDLPGAFPGYLTAEPADDDSEFSFEVDPFGELHRVCDRVPLPRHGRRGLEEQDGLGRWRLAHLPRALGIVLADPHDLARQDR